MALTLGNVRGFTHTLKDATKIVKPTKDRGVSDASTGVGGSPVSRGRMGTGVLDDDVWVDVAADCGSPKNYDDALLREELKMNGFDNVDGGHVDWFKSKLQDEQLDLHDVRFLAKLSSHGYCQVMPFPHLGHAPKKATTQRRGLFGPRDFRAAAKADRKDSYRWNGAERILAGEDYDNDAKLLKDVTQKHSSEPTNERNRRLRAAPRWQESLAVAAATRELEDRKKARQARRNEAREFKTSARDPDGWNEPIEQNEVVVHHAARMMHVRMIPRSKRFGLIQPKLKARTSKKSSHGLHRKR